MGGVGKTYTQDATSSKTHKLLHRHTFAWKKKTSKIDVAKLLPAHILKTHKCNLAAIDSHLKEKTVIV